MTLYRCFPWERGVRAGARGGPLWFPRMLQGAGRHDNPHLYGCLYVTEGPLSAVVEQLARLAGTSLAPPDLVRRGRPLALARIELADDAGEVVDLDEPAVLERERLRPSLVATHERARTQADAAALYERHERAVALRWWSTFESLWANVTLFDRAAEALSVADVSILALDDDVVGEAAEFLGLPIAT